MMQIKCPTRALPEAIADMPAGPERQAAVDDFYSRVMFVVVDVPIEVEHAGVTSLDNFQREAEAAALITLHSQAEE